MTPATCCEGRHIVSAAYNLTRARVTLHASHLARFKPDGNQHYSRDTL